MPIPDPSLRTRIQVLEDRLRDLEGEVRLARQSANAQVAPRERWLAKIKGTPAAGDDTFEVELLSCRFTAAAGVQAIQERLRGSRVICRSFPARSYVLDDYVVVERIRGQLAGDAETGEWWICAGPAEIRWGRTTAISTSYPDLSAASSVSRSLPIYEIELGHLGFTWPADTSRQVGWQRLDGGTNAIDSTLTNFTADSPLVVVQACSLIGDLHRGQPVLLALEAGKWYVIGPSQVQASRERLTFADGYLESSGAQQDWVTAGDRLSMRLVNADGTGAASGAAPSSYWYDVRCESQSTFADPFAVINRRGDYLISLRWAAWPYRYNYMTGSYLATEAQSLTGATITSTSSSGHTHDVNVKNQTACYWQANLTLNVPGGTYARSVPTVFQDGLLLDYYQPQGSWRQALTFATFNKGDELRLILDLDSSVYSSASMIARGVQINPTLAPELTIMRLGEGGTWIP